jgi:hypothetical protein
MAVLSILSTWPSHCIGLLQCKQELFPVIEFLLPGISTFPSTTELGSRLENDKVVLQTS